MKNNLEIKIGIIGGSGIYELRGLKRVRNLRVKTEYGYPSSLITIYELKKGNKKEYIAFLPRHGEKHSIPPHKIPYKANIAALKSLGVGFIISTFVAGSLKKKIVPGDFLIPDQFIDFTWRRDDYFDIDKKLIHLPMANPYCKNLRSIIYKHSKKIQKRTHKKGVVVVIQGPRFSTQAESKWFIKQDWDIVNMTQYPEVYFAKEMKICYASICTITDYDVGIHDVKRIDYHGIKKVLKIFQENTEKTQKLILDIIKNYKELTIVKKCECKLDLINEYYK